MRKILLILLFLPLFSIAQSPLDIAVVDKTAPRYTEVNDKVKSLALIGNTRKLIEVKGNPSTSYAWFLNQYNQQGEITVLNSYILGEQHGGYQEIIRFEEEGSETKQVAYLENESIIADVDHDGEPEFYLVYVTDRTSEQGSKVVHVLVFTKLTNETDFTIGEIQGVYTNAGKLKIQEADEALLKLAKPIQKKAHSILANLK